MLLALLVLVMMIESRERGEPRGFDEEGTGKGTTGRRTEGRGGASDARSPIEDAILRTKARRRRATRSVSLRRLSCRPWRRAAVEPANSRDTSQRRFFRIPSFPLFFPYIQRVSSSPSRPGGFFHLPRRSIDRVTLDVSSSRSPRRFDCQLDPARR